MGQQEILNILNENPKTWYSIDEIKIIVTNKYKHTGNVWRQINKLCSTGEVETKLQRLDNCKWGYKRVIKAKSI